MHSPWQEPQIESKLSPMEKKKKIRYNPKLQICPEFNLFDLMWFNFSTCSNKGSFPGSRTSDPFPGRVSCCVSITIHTLHFPRASRQQAKSRIPLLCRHSWAKILFLLLKSMSGQKAPLGNWNHPPRNPASLKLSLKSVVDYMTHAAWGPHFPNQ